jgi:hypothetical protein
VVTLLKALFVAVAGLALGLWATREALSSLLPFSADRLGQWRIESRAGAADADPYTRARVERDGEIPLGLGEGLRLTTREDSDRRALNPACVYRFGPHAPPARYWTLEAVDAEGFPLENPAGRYVLRSSEILRDPDGGFTVYISPRAHAGNWLPVGGRAPFALALRLYDPALSGAAVGVERGGAPEVVKVRCG